MSMPASGSSVTVFGATYSVYVRIVLATLHEKHVAYDLVPVDVFSKEDVSADYLDRQPFGRIPAFEHEGFRLFETSAIARYVDEAFPGPPLQPESVRHRARMNQIVAMLDNYAYRPMVWDVYVQRMEEGDKADETRIAAGLENAGIFLRALTGLMTGSQWFAGPDFSLADLHAAPIFGYFVEAPEGAALLRGYPELADWWDRVRARAGIAAALE
jgi:glutathione S-transferase